MTTEQRTGQPSGVPSVRQLWRATALAAVVAVILLFTIVLPAEYGIDPTGVGTALGLSRAPEPATTVPNSGAASTAPAIAPDARLRRSAAVLKTDAISVVLRPGEGAERKAIMSAGQTMVYQWRAEGGSVDVDMHGEAANAPEGEFTSYWKDEGQTGDQGIFTAPVTGQHGWFWQNLNDEAVTIHLRTSGFYDRLITP